MMWQWQYTTRLPDRASVLEEEAFPLPLSEPPVNTHARNAGGNWPECTEMEGLTEGRVGKGGAMRSVVSLCCP